MYNWLDSLSKEWQYTKSAGMQNASCPIPGSLGWGLLHCSKAREKLSILENFSCRAWHTRTSSVLTKYCTCYASLNQLSRDISLTIWLPTVTLSKKVFSPVSWRQVSKCHVKVVPMCEVTVREKLSWLTVFIVQWISLAHDVTNPQMLQTDLGFEDNSWMWTWFFL